MNKKNIFIIFLCLTFYNIGYSQSTKGNNFWFGYLSNYYGPGGSPLYVYISAENNVSGTISVPGISFSQPFTVAANTTLRITMPIVEPPYSDGIFDLAVHVQTCDKVTVYAQNAGAATNDATVIFPSSGLGDRYMVLNINGWPLDLGDEVLIVATQNNSQIRITPSVNTGGGQLAGVPFIITLNAGQTYQMTNTATGQNLSGTIIENVTLGQCSPFAVFSGNLCLNIGGCTACDHLYEQLLPLSALGKEYVLPPLDRKSVV